MYALNVSQIIPSWKDNALDVGWRSVLVVIVSNSVANVKKDIPSVPRASV